MRVRAAVAATALMFSVTTASMAHLPADEVFGAFQWPSNQLPVLDGNISEWNALPAELWVDSNDFGATQGLVPEVDASDFFFRIAVGWNDELDRIYFVSERFDDVYDRDGDRDDTYEFGWDTDHSADDFWATGVDAADLPRERGRGAQSGHFAWPENLDGEARGNWFWFWMTQITEGASGTNGWASEEPYACCDDSFRLDGSLNGEATLFAEWYVTGFDDFNWEGPEGSVQHDLVEGEIIGIGMSVTDTDVVDAEGNAAFEKYVLGGENLIFGDASFFSDYLLLEIDEAALATAVEDDSWGRIKASYGD